MFDLTELRREGKAKQPCYTGFAIVDFHLVRERSWELGRRLTFSLLNTSDTRHSKPQAFNLSQTDIPYAAHNAWARYSAIYHCVDVAREQT